MAPGSSKCNPGCGPNYFRYVLPAAGTTRVTEIVHNGQALWDAVRSVARFERDGPPFQRASRDIPAPASFAQERIWLIDRLLPGRPIHNLTVAIRLSGPLAEDCLHRALSEMVRRHEVL